MIQAKAIVPRTKMTEIGNANLLQRLERRRHPGGQPDREDVVQGRVGTEQERTWAFLKASRAENARVNEGRLVVGNGGVQTSSVEARDSGIRKERMSGTGYRVVRYSSILSCTR